MSVQSVSGPTTQTMASTFSARRAATCSDAVWTRSAADRCTLSAEVPRLASEKNPMRLPAALSTAFMPLVMRLRLQLVER